MSADDDPVIPYHEQPRWMKIRGFVVFFTFIFILSAMLVIAAVAIWRAAP